MTHPTDEMKGAALEWFNRHMDYHGIKHPQEYDHVETIRKCLEPIKEDASNRETEGGTSMPFITSSTSGLDEAIEYLIKCKMKHYLKRQAVNTIINGINNLLAEISRLKKQQPERVTVDSLKKSLLRGEYSSLTISCNDHACNYVSVKKWLEEYQPDQAKKFISEDEKQKTIDTNTVWGIQWYPDTPVGFYVLYASTFEALVSYMISEKYLPYRPKNIDLIITDEGE